MHPNPRGLVSLHREGRDTMDAHRKFCLQTKVSSLRRSSPRDAWVSDFQLPELWEINVSWLIHQPMVLYYGSPSKYSGFRYLLQ